MAWRRVSINLILLMGVASLFLLMYSQNPQTMRDMMAKSAEAATGKKSESSSTDKASGDGKEVLVNTNPETIYKTVTAEVTVEATKTITEQITQSANIVVSEPISTAFSVTHFKSKKYNFEKYIISKSRNLDSQEPSVLIVSAIAGNSAFGGPRKFEDFMKMFSKLSHNKNDISLGFLFKSKDELTSVMNFLLEYENSSPILEQYYRITLIYAPFIEDTFTASRGDRHNDNIQKLRRRVLSRTRNFLINHSAANEDYILSFDSDVIDVPSQMLDVFISSDKDIIVPRVRMGDNQDYDLNTWAGPRVKPNAAEFEKLNANKNDENDFVFIPNRVPGKTRFLSDMIDKKIADNSEEAGHYAVEVNSVGGAVLFFKTEIFRQGVIFPPFYVIGAEWERVEGYDGIETEGICYQAKVLGYSCFAFPNIVASHYVE
ncbi:hypothetical protein PACTADRAFT_50349 [Pachysolen tannophilus NRRL Y-2460]|uniref:Glycosyltransferase family 62 protein n=1 Tax=Pachysolen tannophilus NRRL Y-2460 TaxID=669874 RepID=A0A1E4TV81_PACTA|nr:hypothetical protein PACTADRAFT_50349 [Pachysolen tannophilus NRRL Y-2460]